MTIGSEQAYPDYIGRNQKAWSDRDSDYAATMRAKWASEPSWGIWDIPESQLRLLPDVTGRDVLEIGCGAAYLCAWLSQRGARVTGIDPTASQLQLATRFQREFDLHFSLVAGVGEMLPFPDEAFDVAISEYGAAIWADPYAWVPEAARVLRPGGELIIVGNSALLTLCVAEREEEGPAGNELLRPYF
ncbi:MAG TPA: class I SAM-dependent methyltransferase [Actinomycetota bacterium]|nr:class I SAM-dependent methyltransferase [Actinomycetota bacterium]